MSGYLHNLARRALRRTSPLHSVAILPFASAPSLPPQEEESRVALRPLPRKRESPDAARDVKPDAANRPARDEDAPTRRAPERDPHRLLVPEPLVPPPARMAAPLARAHPLADDSGITPRATASATQKPGRAVASREPHDTASEGTSPPQEMASPRVAPERQVMTVTSRRAPATTAIQGPRPLQAVETATEVHLSIGRVEVAVLAQSPAPKETRPRARTMSLAQYEQRRRERER